MNPPPPSKLQAPARLRFALVEDDSSYRDTIASLIGDCEGCQCVGSFATSREALAALPACAPDVVLVDIRMPDPDGIAFVAALKPSLPDTEFVMLTSFDDTDLIFGALRAGASGYLLKSAGRDDLLAALRQVVAGGVPMDGVVARKIIQTFRQPPGEPLSPREEEVLAGLASGLLYKEIAARLGVGYSTINTHVKQIYRKLHVRSRQQAVRAWRSHT